MTITIEEGLAKRIEAVAAVRGESPDRYLLSAVKGILDRDEGESHLLNLASLPERNGKLLSEFVDDQRSKHRFPSEWGTRPVHLTEEDWDAVEAAEQERLAMEPR